MNSLGVKKIFDINARQNVHQQKSETCISILFIRQMSRNLIKAILEFLNVNSLWNNNKISLKKHFQ